MNTDTHEREEKLRLVESKKVETGVKAVKNDDAKVDEDGWDIWSVNSFELTKSNTLDVVWSAKVCVTGSFSKKDHGSFFTAWRSLMHSVYRRRLVRSFINYLKLNYGTDWGQLLRCRKRDRKGLEEESRTSG